jgi:hypothetical protein
VSAATAYTLDGRRIGVRFSAVARELSLPHSVHIGSGGHPAYYPVDTGGSVPRGEADYSASSSAKIKNAWSYTSTPPYMFFGMVIN